MLGAKMSALSKEQPDLEVVKDQTDTIFGKPDDFNVELYASAGSVILKSMANRHRLLILLTLKRREYSAGELEEIVGLSQSALSQHLARLRKDGLVKTRRAAQMIFYNLPDNQARVILETIHNIFAQSGSIKTAYI
jgi:DNA-binding transcriptional ArsR family regulator